MRDRDGMKDLALGLASHRYGPTHARLTGITDGVTEADARRLYLAGSITVERFEEMLGEALGLAGGEKAGFS